MRAAVLSDIHANLVALQATLRDLERRRVDSLWCLGDLVGYSCLPRETLALLRECGAECVQGNHDLMAIGRLYAACGPNASAAMRWTRGILTDDDLRFLSALPGHAVLTADILLQHSCWNDPVTYLRRREEYAAQYRAIHPAYPTVRFCFTGHTHLATVVEIDPNGEEGERQATQVQSDLVTFRPDRFYFINPGSVGHPRDGEQACYAIYDSGYSTVSFHRVSYDHHTMAALNARHGIHTQLANHKRRWMPSAALRVLRRVGKIQP